jgi:hypothetical protein
MKDIENFLSTVTFEHCIGVEAQNYDAIEL